jgi:CubicO group peptidase (beta-lactamase class C family)
MLAVVLTLGGCRSLAVAPYVYRAPETTPNGIETSSIEEAGGVRAQAERLVGQFLAGSWGDQHSLLIMRHGRLVLEEYFGGWTRDSLHEVQSVSKSIASLLVGHAVNRGGIRSVDDPIINYLPQYRSLLSGGKERITIRHLLTMSSGLTWDEGNPPYSNPANIRWQEIHSADAVAFVLGRPISHLPGQRWNYNGGTVTIVAEIAARSLGLSNDAFLAEALGGVLARNELRALAQTDGRLNAAGGFFMTPRAMIKIGQAVLNEGRWGGREVFDPDWIRESTTAHIATTNGRMYGYLWYVDEYRAGGKKFSVVLATGYGGQEIIVVPALDLVVVMTAGNFADRPSRQRLMEREVLPVFVR